MATTAWGEFPNTVLHFRGDGAPSIDLRVPIDAAQHALLAGMGLARPFGVVTACDPEGQTSSAPDNAARMAGLYQELDGAGVRYTTLDACDVDRSHCEASAAVLLPCGEVVSLARRYRQLAIFWFDGDRFWIIPALSPLPPVQLPVKESTPR